jgi:hypothetical protein
VSTRDGGDLPCLDLQPPEDVLHEVNGIMCGNIGGEASAYSSSTIQCKEWENGIIELRFNLIIAIIIMLKDAIVLRSEDVLENG